MWSWTSGVLLIWRDHIGCVRGYPVIVDRFELGEGVCCVVEV
jgi:hypothetical protein